jgi:hypothetical protein
MSFSRWSEAAMPLERVLQILMAALATLATLMLGMGERNPLLPLLVVVVAASSIYFTDIKGWIRLNTSVANLAGLAAVVASLWDYMNVTQERQLLALANLLIYLQCVLLYRPKSPRIYWMLALLTLLQVAVATVLNLSVWFGALLVVYLFLALTTLALFLIYREQSRFAELASRRAQQDQIRGAQSPVGRLWSPGLSGFAPRTHGTALDAAMPSSLARLVARMGLYTLGLTTFLFIVVPRTGGMQWGEQPSETHHTVGFTDKVTLGEMGEIIENPEEVMQVRFFDHATDEPYRLTEVPLLRGSILMIYQDGAWQESRRGSQAHRLPKVPPGATGLVKQEVQIGHLDTSTLFAIYPLMQDRPDNKVVYDGDKDRLVRSQGVFRYPLNYELVTSGFVGGRQRELVPAWREPDSEDELLQLPRGENELTQLKHMAEQVVERSGADDIVLRARVLERYLRDSGTYQYTLSPPDRKQELDQIEDFLIHNRQGHCEYFASALALMLRSVGIPARMVVGFKGADWNPLSGYYHVRQLHAHTWVEIYLRPDQIPAGTFAADEVDRELGVPPDWQYGAWLRLDPTPGVAGGELLASSSKMPSLRQIFDYADYLWTSYVLSMDRRRQHERIFNPVKKGSEGFFAVLFDRRLWRKTFQNLGKILRGERIDDGGIWFSWHAGLLTVVSLLTLLALYKLTSWAVRRLFHLDQRQSIETGRTGLAEAEFYRRLEALLAQQQLVRGATQTQREFAHEATEHLAGRLPTRELAAIPKRVTDAYYQVRFGRLPLDNHEALAVEHALDELSAHLAVGNGHDVNANGGAASRDGA